MYLQKNKEIIIWQNTSVNIKLGQDSLGIKRKFKLY